MSAERKDRRKTCECGHRHHVHASNGQKCLAVMDDGKLCWCHQWKPVTVASA